MSKEMMAVIAFGGICIFALAMFVAERRAAAKRLEARGGREIDVSNLIAFGSKAGEGNVTHK
ncbi:MAG: hypothetical protein AB8B71_14545 [Paracoccaceae bacterium]